MPELPSGTVTFLFTDIEGSTQLLRRLRQRYGDTLADHRRLLRSACAEAGGQEIGMQGDAVFVVFRKASEAVLGAVAAQRALARYDWPEGAEFRVRMGLHTGEATVSAAGYVGLAVHRVARICAAGHGGQILLSQTTQALLEDEEEELGDVSLDDLGPQRLKDFERPVRIFQVVAPGLSDAFPPLRTEQPTPFPGSEGELVEAASTASTSSAASNSTSISILIVDDQALVRAGFRMIIDAEDGLEVVGEAANGLEAVAETLRLKPNIVLMDVRMPEVDGIEATRRLLGEDALDTKVVMLTTFDMDEYVYDAFRAGASGFMLKDAPPEQLVAGIRAVASGDALLAPSLTRRVIEEFVGRSHASARMAPPRLGELTTREVEVLKLIARGLSNAEIAKELVVSETTIKTHVAHVLTKLDLRDRVQAVVLAYDAGIVEPGRP